MKRRLAAIMAADVVGYSRLMGADEIGTLERLKALRRELVQPRIAAHGGRVVKLMGDGLLAEFESAVDAVECGAEIQEGVAEREREGAEATRIRLRVGVNLGDVIHEGADVYGDGVNVAARLEGIAEPGGMSVSAAVHDLVRDRARLAFEDAGEQQLKNIERPVRVWRWRTGAPVVAAHPAPREGGHPRPAIAVLPFANMSADPEQEYFSDGLTEDIITALTYWRSFPVIARNSSFAYKGQSPELRRVGRELGARYVLEGSVRRAADRIRITAQLIDCASGHHVWAERYDRDLDDIFAVQDDIVQRIAAVVAPEVAKAERDRMKENADLDAWDLCLRAMPHLRRRTAEGDARARELFLQAIEIQPDYSDAHAGLAQSHHQDILISHGRDRRETAELAMAAARRAVECDEASSWAHHELSTAYQWLDRIDDALDEARVSVELNPYDAYAIHALGNKSDLAGDPEGVAHMERAQKLNPEDARRYTHLVFLARAYVNRGEHEAAVEVARQSLRRKPDYAAAHYILAIALGHLGRIEEGRAALARCDELSPGFVEGRRGWAPYRDAEANARLHEGLRRLEAGAGDA